MNQFNQGANITWNCRERLKNYVEVFMNKIDIFEDAVSCMIDKQY